ncbi:hypothetical protein ACJJTC_011265 [Scirpophaga incertulas]
MMSVLINKLPRNNIKTIITRSSEIQSCRHLSIVPSLYDDKDPAPTFFSSQVQILLKRLTRPDLSKVFRKRCNTGLFVLRTPTYKFLTDKELEAEIAKANEKAEQLLQMPPVVKMHQTINEVLSEDPALIGYDSCKYLFTDITYGVKNEHRIIVERDPDGVLRNCDHDIRKRLNQTYFPMNGRKIKEPIMFSDKDRFNDLLDNSKYEFILDRACIQYEPDEPKYQSVTSITYQHIDLKKCYEILRSTRHFGPMTFYLTWHQSMDNLMLELLQGNAIREAVLLTSLRQHIHGDVINGGEAHNLAQQILPTPKQSEKPENLTEEDIQLDNKCVECIEKFIVGNSAMKSQHELALQGFREHYQQLIDLSRGLRKAHGGV